MNFDSLIETDFWSLTHTKPLLQTKYNQVAVIEDDFDGRMWHVKSTFPIRNNPDKHVSSVAFFPHF